MYVFVAIRGPKALQEAWDKTKTVRQKYVDTVRSLRRVVVLNLGQLHRTWVAAHPEPNFIWRDGGGMRKDRQRRKV